jgi:hypothetical protein
LKGSHGLWRGWWQGALAPSIQLEDLLVRAFVFPVSLFYIKLIGPFPVGLWGFLRVDGCQEAQNFLRACRWEFAELPPSPLKVFLPVYLLACLYYYRHIVLFPLILIIIFLQIPPAFVISF